MRIKEISIDSIIVGEDRQRRELSNIEELAESIQRHGLINPITVQEDGDEFILIAGERRLTAFIALGLTSIPAQFLSDLTPMQREEIELEENIKRVQLSWQDEVQAVARLHELRCEAEPQWAYTDTAEQLGKSSSLVARQVRVAQELGNNPELAKVDKFSSAWTFVSRQDERKKGQAIRNLQEEIGATQPKPERIIEEGQATPEEPKPEHSDRYAQIHNVSFLGWAQQPRESKYNLIHCDFPYGVSAGDKMGQSSSKTMGGYADGRDVYFELLECFCSTQDNFIAEQAHLVFWYSMDHHTVTIKMLEKAGWKVNPFPLIWFKTDNKGIIPDHNRGPRRVYETALFASRGDRKIVRPVSNCIGAQTTKNFHMSEKSAVMLEHFFRMLVDESTWMLDPTCGGANAVKVAEKLGAAYSLGLEMDADFAQRAKDNLGL